MTLPAVDSDAALTALPAGVHVTKDTAAVVRLPADPGAAAGVWTLTLTPDTARYPGATFTPAGTGANVTYKIPVVTRVAPVGVSVDGQSTLTVTGTGLGSLSATDPKAVVLRDGAGTDVPATVVSTTSTTVVVTTAAVAAGPWRVVVHSGLGEARDAGRADKVTAVAASAFTSSATLAAAAGGTRVTLTASGFGATSRDFAANKITAAVDGKSAATTWVDDRTVTVAVPAGVPGRTAKLTLTRLGVPGPTVVSVTYAASITTNSGAVVRTTGGTITYGGVGFAGASTWVLHTPGGSDVTLPVVGSAAALSAAHSGVFVRSDKQAVVKTPALASGLYWVGFTPDQSRYPAATSVFTSKSVLSASAFG